MAVGSKHPNNVKAEMFEFRTGKWMAVEDYPYTSDVFNSYEMIYIPELLSYLVIGGADGTGADMSQLAMLTNGEWVEAGRLNSARVVSFLIESL